MPRLGSVQQALIGLCVLSAGLILFEVAILELRAYSADQQMPAALVENNGEIITDTSKNNSVADYSKLDDRPLFVQGRRHLALSELMVSPAEAPPVEPPSLNIRLVGVSLSSDQQSALILDSINQYHAIRVGDAWQGWKLESLAPDQALLVQSGREITLDLNPSSGAAQVNRVTQDERQ